MDNKTLTTAVVAVGILVLAASLFADSLGIGANPGFGLNQTIGSVVGAIVTAVGLFLKVKSK